MPPQWSMSAHPGPNAVLPPGPNRATILGTNDDLIGRGGQTHDEQIQRRTTILVAELVGTMILILGGPGTIIFGKFIGVNSVGTLGVAFGSA